MMNSRKSLFRLYTKIQKYIKLKNTIDFFVKVMYLKKRAGADYKGVLNDDVPKD